MVFCTHLVDLALFLGEVTHDRDAFGHQRTTTARLANRLDRPRLSLSALTAPGERHEHLHNLFVSFQVTLNHPRF